MVISILGDAKLQELDIECPREKWDVFILTIRSKSISYYKSKKALKEELTKQIDQTNHG